MNTTGKLVGYARVSSADQNLDRQLEVLSRADKIFTEKISGSSRERPELTRMLEYVREGDTVLVKSPDRLARSTTDLLALVEQLRAKDVQIEFIDNPALNTDTPQRSEEHTSELQSRGHLVCRLLPEKKKHH